MSSGRYYVVFEGRQRGVYESWPDCQREVSGYPHALYKKYRTKAEAFEAFDIYIRGLQNPILHQNVINEVDRDMFVCGRTTTGSRSSLMAVLIVGIIIGYLLGMCSCGLI